MSGKNNSTCSICGEPYYLCISCRDKMAAAPWKMHCDTAEHYKVYQIISGYNAGIYTQDEAQKRFEKVDLSDMHRFREHIRAIIEEILGTAVNVDNAENNDAQEHDNNAEQADKTEQKHDVVANKKQTQFARNNGRRR